MAEALIETSVPPSTPAHIRDATKELIVAGERWTSEPAQDPAPIAPNPAQAPNAAQAPAPPRQAGAA